MAIESLVAFGIATLILLAISIYAKSHRAEDKKFKEIAEFDFPE